MYKHGSALRWQQGSDASALDVLPALLTSFAACGKDVKELCLNGAQLPDAHCQALTNAVSRGALEQLCTLQLEQDEPYLPPVERMLGVILGRCRHLTSLNLSKPSLAGGGVAVCKLLRTMPPPSQPYSGLQTLCMRRWKLTIKELRALRNTLRTSTPALVKLDLSDWYWVWWEGDSHALVTDIIGAALSSGTLRELLMAASCELVEKYQSKSAVLLQSHSCTLVSLELQTLITFPRHLAPVLAHNVHLQRLDIVCGDVGDDTPEADRQAHTFHTQALLQALHGLTSLTSLDYDMQYNQHDPAATLRPLTKLTHLAIRSLNERVLGPHNAINMAATLSGMPHLRSLALRSCNRTNQLVGNLHAVVATDILQGCSTQLTSLVCLAIRVDAAQPFSEQAAAALQRLTNLRVLKLRGLAWRYGQCPSKYIDCASALAAVASALPHLTALEELDVGGETRDNSADADMAWLDVLDIVSAASKLPCLRRIALPYWLRDQDRLAFKQLLQTALPSLSVGV